MLILDLHYFYQAANDLSTGSPVGLIQSLADLFGELVQMREHQAKLGPARGVIRSFRSLLVESLEPLSGPLQARLEFALVQQPFFVSVDQAADATPGCGDLLVDLFEFDVGLAVPAEASLELLPQVLWVLEQRPDVGPHGAVEPVHTNRLVRTDASAAEPVAVHARAAIVWIWCLLIEGESAQALAVVGVPATAAFQQALEQVPRAAPLLPAAFAVLGNGTFLSHSSCSLVHPGTNTATY